LEEKDSTEKNIKIILLAGLDGSEYLTGVSAGVSIIFISTAILVLATLLYFVK